jgi:hypothetical protein
MFLILAGTPFKQIHLADLSLERMEQDEAFQRDFAALLRSMQCAWALAQWGATPLHGRVNTARGSLRGRCAG